ncbi:DMT family transporter [Erwinia tasmaniensis]|uniref:DMT family transporter n=1 Tax=Erwinia tasmaniensis TaxID=338565 RepID=UPI003A4E30F7
MKQTKPVNGSLIGILGGVILSFDSVFIRLMGIHDSWTIVMLRGFFMWAVCLLVWALWRQSRLTLGKPWLTRENALPTLFFAIASACFVNGLNRGNVATVLVIISSTPFISALISRLFFKVKCDRSVMVAALMGIVGVVIVMSGRSAGDSAVANLYALGTAVSMALAFIFTARVEGGTLALPSLGGVMASVAILLWSGEDMFTTLRELSLTQYGWSLAEGMLVMPLAMGFITLSTRYVSPANAGLFLLLETALAPLWMAIFLAEMPTPHAVTGGVIIVVAVISQTLYARRQVSPARYADAG